jgi:hypothetical protein
MALSSTEVEHMAPSLATCEALWLRKLFFGLFDVELEATMIHCDNQSGIKFYKNHVFHDHRKHIDIHYHFLQDCVQKGSMKLQYIQTDDKMANIFTKALRRQKFEKFRDKMGLVQNIFLIKRDC